MISSFLNFLLVCCYSKCPVAIMRLRLKKEILAKTYPPIPWIFAPRKDRWECGEDARPLDLPLKSCLMNCLHLCHPLTLKFPINLSESVEQTQMKMQRVVKALSCWFSESTSFRLVWFNFLWWVKRWPLEMLERVLLHVYNNPANQFTSYANNIWINDSRAFW